MAAELDSTISPPDQGQSPLKRPSDASPDDNGKRRRLSAEPELEPAPERNREEDTKPNGDKQDPESRGENGHNESANVKKAPVTADTQVEPEPRKSEPPRRRLASDRAGEERRRGRRLFGSLLSTLSQAQSQPSPALKRRKRSDSSAQGTDGSSAVEQKQETAQQRLREREQGLKQGRQDRQQNEHARNVTHHRATAETQARRARESVAYVREAMRVRHANVYAMARSLRTRTQPSLYYRPWKLTEADERVVETQVKEAEAMVKSEREEFEKRHRPEQVDVQQGQEVEKQEQKEHPQETEKSKQENEHDSHDQRHGQPGREQQYESQEPPMQDQSQNRKPDQDQEPPQEQRQQEQEEKPLPSGPSTPAEPAQPMETDHPEPRNGAGDRTKDNRTSSPHPEPQQKSEPKPEPELTEEKQQQQQEQQDVEQPVTATETTATETATTEKSANDESPKTTIVSNDNKQMQSPPQAEAQTPNEGQHQEPPPAEALIQHPTPTPPQLHPQTEPEAALNPGNQQSPLGSTRASKEPDEEVEEDKEDTVIY